MSCDQRPPGPRPGTEQGLGEDSSNIYCKLLEEKEREIATLVKHLLCGKPCAVLHVDHPVRSDYDDHFCRETRNSQHLLRTHEMPDIVLSIFHILTPVILTTTQ